MTEVHKIRCDGCEREANATDVDGWWNIQEVVTTRERYEKLVEEAHEKGVSGALSGDFCSLPCIESWARNAEVLKGLEPPQAQ